MAKIIFDSEKELENFIVEKIRTNGHCPITGDVVDSVYQQLSLGGYGITDILTMMFEPVPGGPPTIHYRIIEVKKELIKNDSVAQLTRYIKGLSHILSETDLGHEWTISGLLVAPQIDKSSDTCFLIDCTEDINFYRALFDLESGIDFECQAGWWKADTGVQQETLDVLDKANKEVREQWSNNALISEAANG